MSTHHKRIKKKNDVWKIAYADFMTALMAFFLLLWLLNKTPSDALKTVGKYVNSILQYRGVGTSTKESTKDGDKKDSFSQKSDDSFSELDSQIENIGDGSIDRRYDGSNMYINVYTSYDDMVFAASDRTIIKKDKIMEIARILSKNTDVQIAINCYLNPYDKSNGLDDDWLLGFYRAKNVRALLIAGGVGQNAIQSLGSFGPNVFLSVDSIAHTQIDDEKKKINYFRALSNNEKVNDDNGKLYKAIEIIVSN